MRTLLIAIPLLLTAPLLTGCTGATGDTATCPESGETTGTTGTTFACGDVPACDIASEYCYVFIGGVKPLPGDDGVDYSCRPLPEECLDCATCGCLKANDPELQYDTANDIFQCEPVEGGGIRVTVAGA